MKKNIGLIFLLSSISINAAELKSASYVCDSKKSWTEFKSVFMQNDEQGLEYYLSSSCIMIGEGFTYSVLDHSIVKGWCKIRLYFGDKSEVVYGPLSLYSDTFRE